ncbi:MAG: hypothetical protein WC196_03110 [Bacilli bacterium]|nr:hypothetical protein [Bacilli bacterium]MDD3422225.1 hypothetical protein [Bacilli bacterium]MDD4065713.1 hypothetical protein [Bacilli bacterium]
MHNSFILDLAKKTPTAEQIINSDYFQTILDEYLRNVQVNDTHLFELLNSTFKRNLHLELKQTFLKLLKTNYQSLKASLYPLSEDQDEILSLLDGLYDTWRNKQRYALINYSLHPLTSAAFIKKNEQLGAAIVKTYRIIYENVLGHEQMVYRQLPSGTNAGFILKEDKELNYPQELAFMKGSLLLQTLLIRPPFIASSEQNTRKGIFKELALPLRDEDYDSSDHIGVALKIKGHVGYVFISKAFMSFIVGLGNLFRVVDFNEVKDVKPDFIIAYGVNVEHKECYYYKSKDGIYVGVCPFQAEIDYFGYLKKMILTLHNLVMIDEGKLPIHGAAIKVILNNGKSYNIVIMGDSGAGKSETIEALGTISDSSIHGIVTIYDDMGTFILQDKEVYTNGTETGAFVRLDDLDKGYSLRSIDRSVYLNIETVNSRVVIPITTYKETKSLHHVDAFLLADNFTNSPVGITEYKDEVSAKKDFIKGERVAKGTTSEVGRVTTFLANPFGPVQRQKDCEVLIDQFFDALYKNGIFVGKIYTKLSLDPLHGPQLGAKALLKLIKGFKGE